MTRVKTHGMKTIDVSTKDYICRADACELIGKSQSTLARIIRLLRDAAPDEFDVAPYVKRIPRESFELIRWASQKLTDGLTRDQISQLLERGLPDECQ